uniref:Secreted protein n=1 Tax=Romanomermis culicivorax TaxID=13658 RepID=A0A915I454_ROMCU
MIIAMTLLAIMTIDTTMTATTTTMIIKPTHVPPGTHATTIAIDPQLFSYTKVAVETTIFQQRYGSKKSQYSITILFILDYVESVGVSAVDNVPYTSCGPANGSTKATTAEFGSEPFCNMNESRPAPLTERPC